MSKPTTFIAATALFLAATHAQAALAPNYQRAAEINAVVEAVAAKIETHAIDKVIYQKQDEYRVIAGPCSVKASIVTKEQSQPMVGARQFEVKLSTPKCKR